MTLSATVCVWICIHACVHICMVYEFVCVHVWGGGVCVSDFSMLVNLCSLALFLTWEHISCFVHWLVPTS